MNAHRQCDVLVAGDLFLDLVMSGFPALPQPGEEAFATRFRKEAGGGAAITACGLAKLGLRTAVLGVVGMEDGAWLLNRLRNCGVDTSEIRQIDDEPTAFTISVSSSLDRTFLTYNGANIDLPKILGDALFSRDAPQCLHVHLAHAIDPGTMLPVFDAIKNRGWTLSLDAGWHPAWYADSRVAASLPLVDVFFPNQREAEKMTQQTDPLRMLDALRSMGCRTAALKLGNAGAVLLCEGQTFVQEPGHVKAVDTTGAGDCFNAGFLYAFLRGMPPALCLKSGTACGEMSTRALGGIASFPSKEELESVLCIAK